MSEIVWNGIGNLILGEGSFKLYQTKLQQLSGIAIGAERRAESYEKLARNVLERGDAGSSAAGEQPKFSCVDAENYSYRIVKFSPFTEGDLGRRVADCLLAEHLALRTLRNAGVSAAQSRIVAAPKAIKNFGEGRVFLDVERFDRLNDGGRIGVVSLEVLSAQFVGGRLDSWIEQGEGLLRSGVIQERDFKHLCQAEFFGRFIANNDRHGGNFSFLLKGYLPEKSAPIYDMLPMLYMPKNNQIIEREYTLPLLDNMDYAEQWLWALALAKEYWTTISNGIHSAYPKVAAEVPEEIDFSDAFRAIAGGVLEKLKPLEDMAARLQGLRSRNVP